jgi:hypothetical protein
MELTFEGVEKVMCAVFLMKKKHSLLDLTKNIYLCFESDSNVAYELFFSCDAERILVWDAIVSFSKNEELHSDALKEKFFVHELCFTSNKSMQMCGFGCYEVVVEDEGCMMMHNDGVFSIGKGVVFTPVLQGFENTGNAINVLHHLKDLTVKLDLSKFSKNNEGCEDIGEILQLWDFDLHNN